MLLGLLSFANLFLSFNNHFQGYSMTIFCQWIHFLPIFCASQFINVPQFKKQAEHCSVNSDELTENQ